MSRCLAFVAIILIVSACSGNHSTPDILTEYGLSESTTGRGTVDSTISLTDTVLSASNIHMKSFWSVKKIADVNGKAIICYLVQPDGLPFQTIAHTEPENKVIFVASDWRLQCHKEFESIFTESTANRLTLAVVLLHEAGHIDTTKLSPFYKSMGRLFLDDPLTMNEELRADYNAVRYLKNSHSEASNLIKKQLFSLDRDIDINYNDRYSLHGSVLSMMTKDLTKHYNDFTSGHPNMLFRLRIMSYVLEPTKEKMEELKYIIGQRQIYFGKPHFDVHFDTLKTLHDSV